MMSSGHSQPTVSVTRHPVWDLYNELRTARLNVLYYSNRASKSRWTNGGLEIVIGVAGSSAVASAFVGQRWWMIPCAIATIAVPIIRTTLDLPGRIRKYDDCARGYEVLQYDLSVIKQSVASASAYTPEHQQRLAQAVERRRALIEQEPDRQPDARLAGQCQQQVEREFPLDQFFVPA